MSCRRTFWKVSERYGKSYGKERKQMKIRAVTRIASKIERMMTAR